MHMRIYVPPKVCRCWLSCEFCRVVNIATGNVLVSLWYVSCCTCRVILFPRWRLGGASRCISVPRPYRRSGIPARRLALIIQLLRSPQRQKGLSWDAIYNRRGDISDFQIPIELIFDPFGTLKASCSACCHVWYLAVVLLVLVLVASH